MRDFSPRQVLIVGPSWIGDMVMAQSLFRTLKQHYPEIQIDVLAPAWSQPLLKRMPEVRKALDLPLAHGELRLAKRYRLGRGLRVQGYDWSIVLPNSFKSALSPLWARIPRRTGYLGELRFGVLNDVRYLNRKRLPMMVQRFVALGLPPDSPLPEPLPRPRLTLAPASVDSALERLRLERPQALLVLCPGAEFGPAKRWPVEYFAAIARQKQRQGWQVWVFGSERDKEIARAVHQLAESSCVNLAGQTSLAEAIDLLSLATLVITNDSGLMHIAAALNRPLIALYGSSDPGLTPPLNDNARIASLRLPCSPCFKRSCPLGHLRCLRELKPEHVLRLMDELLHPGLSLKRP